MRVETPYGGTGDFFDPILVRSKDDIPGGASLSRSGYVSKENGLLYAVDPRAGYVDPNTIQGNNTASSQYIPSLSNEQNAFIQSLPADQRQLYMSMMNNQGAATWMNDPNNFSRENFRSPYESRLGWSPRNPLSLRSSYTPEFNWLSPMGAARMTRPGVQGSMPMSGFPTDAKLTSIESDIEVNPWLKALFNKDIARRSLHTRFGFNEDLSKFTDDAEEISNEEFAKKQFPEDDKFGRKNRKDLEKILNKGSLTQEEYLASQQPVEDSEVVENKEATEGESDTPPVNYVPSEVDSNNPTGDVDDLDLDNPAINTGLQEIADAQGASQQDPVLSDQQIYQMMEGEQVFIDEDGERRSFDPNAGGIKQDQWYLANNDQKIARDNIYQNILDAPYDEQAELMAIDGITRKDLQEYKTMGPAYAANSRNERIDFQNDVDAGMYKEAVEALGADADPFEIMEWQSDYNSEQRSKAKFEDNKKRFGGTHSGLNKFVLGGFDPTMMYNVEGANRQERQKNILDQMIFNEDNLDNLTIDQLSDRNSQLLADDPVSQMEYDPGMPPPPPNAGQDGNGEFSIETDQKINTAGKFSPETFRQKAGFVSNLGTKAGEAVQDWKNRGSLVNKLFKKSQNANVSQAVNMGDEYANTQGQIAPGSQSRSELMRTMGTTLGKFGGSMAEYGASMGGSYYPAMSLGGPKRVRVTRLPRKDGGGPAGHPHPHPGSSAGEQTYIGGSPEWLNYYNSEDAEDYRTNRYNAYAERRGVKNKPVLTAEDYHKLYSESQRQVYDMNKFYESDAGYINRTDWDSSYEFDPTYANADAAGVDNRTFKGKNWRYHKAINDMNDKIKADNAGMDPAELDKLLYTDFNEADISNSQSGYIGGLISNAAGNLSGQARQDFIHTGVNDQTVEIDGVRQNVTPEDGMGGNTWNNQLDALTIAKRIEEAEEEEEIIPPEEIPEETGNNFLPEETPVKEPDPKDSSVENCNCYPLGADGKPDITKDPISSTPAPADGSDCPPCNATITGKKKQKDDPYEIPVRTDQHYRNMASINRYKIPNIRVNPPQVTNQETVPTLTNFYTGDITAQQNALQRSNNAYAGNSQGAFAKNLAVMSKGLPMTGKRAQDKSGENALKVDKSGQINAQLLQRGDQLNASLLANAGQLNAKYEGERIKAGNARLAALNLEDQRGRSEMEQAMMWNYRNPNHQIGYRGHTPWFRRSYKNANLDPNVVASNTTPKTKKEAKTKSSKYGGPVNSNTFIPRYTTMPFGN